MSDRGHWLRCARNAWQRLGSMSPEAAMEQYIALVLERAPGWMEDKPSGDNKPGSSEVENLVAVTPDLSTSSRQPNFTDEMTCTDPESKPVSEERDPTGGSNLDSRLQILSSITRQSSVTIYGESAIHDLGRIPGHCPHEYSCSLPTHIFLIETPKNDKHCSAA
ncbi:hypothetical protein SADUNF_Sadunf14G0009300 [Salix dunnii]|uniref:ACB domain-containing protein n=1 Tax=Salix dunnii TaxID=1413687 RepID=A0A835JC58_9ROSI|nr:hypothetical protein SADUNF_Sadunf14G0009300 [Salix dunnii]